MKNIQLLSLLLCSVLMAGAQDVKNQIWFSLGGSKPLGEYASTTSTNGGYAQSGVNFKLNYQHHFNPYIGVIVFVYLNANGINHAELARDFERSAPGTTWKVDEAAWSIAGFQVGPVLMYPVTPRMILEARGTIGFNTATSPDIQSTEYSIPATVSEAPGKAPSLVYSFGAGAKFFFNDHWFLPLRFDFMMCSATFDNITITTTSPSGTNRMKVKYDQKMNTYQSSIGIGYAF
jgi:hypothetical protein